MMLEEGAKAKQAPAVQMQIGRISPEVPLMGSGFRSAAFSLCFQAEAS
jgi:hypothetical protein